MAAKVITNAAQVALDLLELAGAADQGVAKIVRDDGAALQVAVARNASGRPGPRVITGNYRRSIQLQYSSIGKAYVASVGSNAPQARRLELGFTGTDSLGRHYNQRAFPHFQPALDKVGPRFEAHVTAFLAKLHSGKAG